MQVTPIKTHIIQPHEDLYAVIDTYFTSENDPNFSKKDKAKTFVLSEKSVVAIASSVVALCEGRIVDKHQATKDELIEQESQFFLPRTINKYNISLTISRNMLVASAGIDESNSAGYFLLWPKDPQKSANNIRHFLQKQYGLKEVGVVLTDSKTTPMRWGVTGISLSYSGFIGVKSLIGRPDLFGKPLEYTTVSVRDAVASAATLEMGESDDSMPFAVVQDSRVVEFVDNDPTQEELEAENVTIDKDMYGDFLKNAPWQKGKAED